MQVILIFTYDVSLKDWKESGLLEREVAIYKELAQNFDIKFTFFDIANLWGVDDNALDESSEIRSAIGIGVDWFTPVGPLSLSLAQPITKDTSDATETFRFNLGTTF